MITYTCERIYQLRRVSSNSKCGVNLTVNLADNELLHYRGKRGGRRVIRNIRVLGGRRAVGGGRYVESSVGGCGVGERIVRRIT